MKIKYVCLVVALVVLGLSFSAGISSVIRDQQSFSDHLSSNSRFTTMSSSQIEPFTLEQSTRFRFKFVGMMQEGSFTVQLEDSRGKVYFSNTEKASSYVYDLLLPAGQYQLVVDCTKAREGAYSFDACY